MLDALIAKMPGAKLTKDGQIYLNGELIQSLLVNGHEFFSGKRSQSCYRRVAEMTCKPRPGCFCCFQISHKP